jgi:hypothetical protein
MPDFYVIAKEQSDCGNPLKVRADFLGFPPWGNAVTPTGVTDEGILSLLIACRRYNARQALLFKSTIMQGVAPHPTKERSTLFGISTTVIVSLRTFR